MIFLFFYLKFSKGNMKDFCINANMGIVLHTDLGQMITFSINLNIPYILIFQQLYKHDFLKGSSIDFKHSYTVSDICVI